VRILIVGAGVIGSVYAGRLLAAGHAVTLCARSDRLAELEGSGLILEDAQTGQRVCHQAAVVGPTEAAGVRCDIALVAVRRDQMMITLPLLHTLKADVVFFGNAAGLVSPLTEAMGPRALFGFPAAAGVREGAVVRFVVIRQQKTMLADPGHPRSERVLALSKMFRTSRFPTIIAADANDWLTAHAAFIVPIALALYRVGVQPRLLAADEQLLRMMVRSTRQAFGALAATGNTDIPRNLLWLYVRLPERFAMYYWRHVLSGPRGELWFAAHTRSAPEEMASLAHALRSVIDRAGYRAPALDSLLADGQTP
jgi:2-dehydropantoate 2-reductase